MPPFFFFYTQSRNREKNLKVFSGLYYQPVMAYLDCMLAPRDNNELKYQIWWIIYPVILAFWFLSYKAFQTSLLELLRVQRSMIIWHWSSESLTGYLLVPCYQYSVGVLTFKYAPSYLCARFVPRSSVHNRDTMDCEYSLIITIPAKYTAARNWASARGGTEN